MRFWTRERTQCHPKAGRLQAGLAGRTDTFDPDWVYTGDFRVESGSRALPYLLGQNVSAIFACNDMMALGIYRESRLYNLRIPNDLSLVGFDDIFLSDFLDPP